MTIYRWADGTQGTRIDFVIVFDTFRLRVKQDGSITYVPGSWKPLYGKHSGWKQVYP